MNRRTAIQSILISGVGIAFLNSCDFSKGKFKIQLKHIFIDENGAKDLSRLIREILPVDGIDHMEGQSAFGYMLKMMDDCSSPDEQNVFNSSLQLFIQYCKKNNNKRFFDFRDAEVKKLLTEMESEKNLSKEILNFYSTVKSYVVQYYTGTQVYMTAYLNYNIIPKPYQGCVTVQ